MGDAMFIATVIVCSLFAVQLVGSGAMKLRRHPKIVEALSAVDVPLDWFPALASAEIAGAAGLLIGLWVAPLGIAAAGCLCGYFVGAVLFHVRARDMKGIPAPAMILVIAAVALWLRIATM